jgi:two-component system, NtrC family, response regulator AtoC
VTTPPPVQGRTGLELLEQVRALDNALPIMMLPAHSSERIALEALKRRAYDYIGKPFDNARLAAGLGALYCADDHQHS